MTRRRPAFSRSRPNGRDLAVQVVYLVDQEAAYAGAAWSQAVSQLTMEPRERRFGMEIAFGSIRRMRTIDWMIQKASGRPIEGIDPIARAVLRTAVYQISFMGGVPVHAAVSEGVESGRRLGHSGIAAFVNAVLRKVSSQDFDPGYPALENDPIAHLAITLSYPDWIVAEWVERFGTDLARSMLEAGNDQPAVVLRANTLRTSSDQLMSELASSGIGCRRGKYVPEAVELDSGIDSVESLPGYVQGNFAVQDESSMLASYAMGLTTLMANGAHPALVIDACAAPGGKSAHMAALGGDRVQIAAFDVSVARSARIRNTVQRLGLGNISVDELDARKLPERYEGLAKAVLVDAPCTGLGVLSRRPDARWRRTVQQREDLALLQREILSACARCVCAGGTLVYTTCTVGPEENESQIEWFLGTHPDFALDHLAPCMPTDSARALAGEGGLVQMLPGVHGVDGFFIARMRRRQG